MRISADMKLLRGGHSAVAIYNAGANRDTASSREGTKVSAAMVRCRGLTRAQQHRRNLRCDVANGLRGNAHDAATRERSAATTDPSTVQAFVSLEHLHHGLREAEDAEEPQEHMMVIEELFFVVTLPMPIGAIVLEHGVAVFVAIPAVEPQCGVENESVSSRKTNGTAM